MAATELLNSSSPVGLNGGLLRYLNRRKVFLCSDGNTIAFYYDPTVFPVVAQQVRYRIKSGGTWGAPVTVETSDSFSMCRNGDTFYLLGTQDKLIVCAYSGGTVTINSYSVDISTDINMDFPYICYDSSVNRIIAICVTGDGGDPETNHTRKFLINPTNGAVLEKSSTLTASGWGDPGNSIVTNNAGTAIYCSTDSFGLKFRRLQYSASAFTSDTSETTITFGVGGGTICDVFWDGVHFGVVYDDSSVLKLTIRTAISTYSTETVVANLGFSGNINTRNLQVCPRLNTTDLFVLYPSALYVSASYCDQYYIIKRNGIWETPVLVQGADGASHGWSHTDEFVPNTGLVPYIFCKGGNTEGGNAYLYADEVRMFYPQGLLIVSD